MKTAVYYNDKLGPKDTSATIRNMITEYVEKKHVHHACLLLSAFELQLRAPDLRTMFTLPARPCSLDTVARECTVILSRRVVPHLVFATQPRLVTPDTILTRKHREATGVLQLQHPGEVLPRAGSGSGCGSLRVTSSNHLSRPPKNWSTLWNTPPSLLTCE